MSGLNCYVKKIAVFLVIPEVVEQKSKGKHQRKTVKLVEGSVCEGLWEICGESRRSTFPLHSGAGGAGGPPRPWEMCVWEEGRMRAAEQETRTWKRSWEVGRWLCGLHVPISQHNLNLILKDAHGKMEMKRFFLLLLWLK